MLGLAAATRPVSDASRSITHSSSAEGAGMIDRNGDVVAETTDDGNTVDRTQVSPREPRYTPPIGERDISLWRKIAEATVDIGSIEASGHNDDRHFTYATESDLYAAVRRPLAERSLVLLTAEVARDRWVLRRVKEGGIASETPIVDVVVRFTLMDGESGETQTTHVTGTRADYDGQAAAGAITSAMRQFLSKTFLIPLEESDQPEATADSEARKNAYAAADRSARERYAMTAKARGLDASGPTVRFGRDKGKPLTLVDDDGLRWLLNTQCKNEKYRKLHERDQAAYGAEAARRGWPVPAADAPPTA